MNLMMFSEPQLWILAILISLLGGGYAYMLVNNKLDSMAAEERAFMLSEENASQYNEEENQGNAEDFFRDSKIANLIQRIVPQSRSMAAATNASLRTSGVKEPAYIVWTKQILCGVVGFLIGQFFMLSLNVPFFERMIVTAVIAVLGFFLPRLMLIRKREQWRTDIKKQLPDAIDVMCISVSAGGTFEAALHDVANRMTGAFAEGCQDVINQATLSDPIDSFMQFAENANVPELTNMAIALQQSAESGASIIGPLKEQSAMIRELRKLELDELASKLDNKITVSCAMPCLILMLVMIVIPIAVKMIAMFTG
jgi:tight adherence protein C